ncbi:MAG: NADH-quinone oxidoreductase subunit A [Candidatus Dadabacteria bacterium]|nr:NADH-quinone oxidoreductase subunit A [Candidatus Dadabacteria bacterium]MCY4046741.1 NADH-quinone oxidoreductase subunit A [Candidatus Dadabacteria bacterium]
MFTVSLRLSQSAIQNGWGVTARPLLDNPRPSLNLVAVMDGDAYAPVVIVWVLTAGLAAVLLFFSVYLGKDKPNTEKSSPYESGITPIGEAAGKFPVNYYIIGALFILFDIEAVFLIAWSMVARELGAVAAVELGAFLAVIVAGYLYVLFKGVLDWR